MDNLVILRQFVRDIDALISSSESQITELAASQMRRLVATDNWLPESMAEPNPQYYQQYLLYLDPQHRFSLVSFVWGHGQQTPIHDHTVWGVIGVLRGAEYSQRYEVNIGVPPKKVGGDQRLDTGQVEIVSPTHGDVHRVRNAYHDRVSVSIHLYGGNIGRIVRKVYDPQTGGKRDFISGYSRILEHFDPFPP